MSHHVYTTRGIVLALRPHAEGDLIIKIITRELGLIFALARGARKPGSKTNPSLPLYGLVRVSLVRGKRQWRVTTVSLIRNWYIELREERAKLKALARVLSLVEALVRGEEKNFLMYDTLESSILNLREIEMVSENVKDWEIFSVALLLTELGYLSSEDAPQTLNDVIERRKEFLSLVNSGIKESGLS